jgi:hypothetical protein
VSRRPNLGIAMPESFSVCRMVNVDDRSPKRHSSISVIQNDQTKHSLHVGIHVEGGAIQYLIQNSCDIGTPHFMDIVDFYGGLVQGSGDKMKLYCQEGVGRAEVLNLMTDEVLEYALGRPSEVRRGITKLMDRCFGA